MAAEKAIVRAMASAEVLRAADHFDQRDQVRRVERVAQHHALRVLRSPACTALMARPDELDARMVVGPVRPRPCGGTGRSRNPCRSGPLSWTKSASATASSRPSLESAGARPRRPRRGRSVPSVGQRCGHGGAQPRPRRRARGRWRPRRGPCARKCAAQLGADDAGADDGDALHVADEGHARFQAARSRLSVSRGLTRAPPGMFPISLHQRPPTAPPRPGCERAFSCVRWMPWAMRPSSRSQAALDDLVVELAVIGGMAAATTLGRRRGRAHRSRTTACRWCSVAE